MKTFAKVLYRSLKKNDAWWIFVFCVICPFLGILVLNPSLAGAFAVGLLCLAFIICHASLSTDTMNDLSEKHLMLRDDVCILLHEVARLKEEVQNLQVEHLKEVSAEPDLSEATMESRSTKPRRRRPYQRRKPTQNQESVVAFKEGI